MTHTNQLPPLPTPKFTETIRGVPCITVTEHEHLMRAYALRAIAQVPMTREQVFASDELMAINGSLLGLNMRDLMQVIRVIEIHHGITVQAQKETP